MKSIRQFLDIIRPSFEEGGKLERLYPLFEATDTFLYTPDRVTTVEPHVRDSMDLKRIMTIVVYAMIPCIFMAMWNTGYQANNAMQEMNIAAVPGWRGAVLTNLAGYDPNSFLSNIIHGALYFIPVYMVSVAVGGAWEVLFGIVRKEDVNEGLLVTSLIFPLTLPPTIPLWQAALGISFGVVVAKELFGGTGRNFVNPALAGRAFLYFAYPAQNSGDAVWVVVDGVSGATPLTALATTDVSSGMEAVNVSWSQAFLGVLPGSLGETSALACLIGAIIIVFTGVGSWRVMVSMLIGGMGFSTFLWIIGSNTNSMFLMPPWWHLVVGGFAFGLVFCVTDPVSASLTETGKWFYGALAGVLTILIRVINPAYPEGVMLAILLANVFAPLIDFFVLQANIKRRKIRNGT
ncbi:Na+-transporting NADH:ubiquinone oxidoreductase, subunit NqrB [Candidatus Scalindua japonica]|uniref:Na(+)-translocating NADH-quinone reductase subunit B n=1 Tax=Candidatus Scalindua japonica TaxID=1284222 RepID=A0A286TXQ1_9BACT|nr:NADH:ubiquinone reductase (Na(+)-transporting) subunit B [Candidatus Scalindua japonica]GAX60668.1 Na+-transporting NADH:ubiquinone oxidoreductase, subunit NqrB [Candidatus Scalindua japonica]